MLEAAWPLARDAALRGAVAGFGRCALRCAFPAFEAVDTLTAEYAHGDGTPSPAPCLVTALPEDLLVHIVQFFDDDKWQPAWDPSSIPRAPRRSLFAVSTRGTHERLLQELAQLYTIEELHVQGRALGVTDRANLGEALVASPWPALSSLYLGFALVTDEAMAHLLTHCAPLREFRIVCVHDLTLGTLETLVEHGHHRSIRRFEFHLESQPEEIDESHEAQVQFFSLAEQLVDVELWYPLDETAPRLRCCARTFTPSGFQSPAT